MRASTPGRWILLIVFLVSPMALWAQDDLRILFVGNSYTYFWNLPKSVEAMAASQDIEIITRKSTAGGTSLKDHWDGKKNLKSREKIMEGGWDYVVIQNHSLSSIEHPDEFKEYGRKFIDLVRQHGAIPILYATWARKYNPLMHKEITQSYRSLGEETGTTVLFVGEAWEQVRQLRPELDLYFPDGSHPSPAGTYLTACMFYSLLTGNPSMELPARISTKDEHGETLYLLMMGNEDAEFLQTLSDSLRKTEQMDH